MRKQMLITIALGAAFICSACVQGEEPEKTQAQIVNAGSYTREIVATPVPMISEFSTEGKCKMSERDIAQIALVTMAEAEGECEEGKRLVIDTILNRLDSAYFPNTVEGVIYQPYQFSSMWNGRAERCAVREDICRLVKEELKSRRNYDVIFFSSEGYSCYGVPVFQVGNHYFSNYD